MKRVLWVCVLALPLCAAPNRALAWGEGGCCLFPPMEIDAGINARFNVHALDWATSARMGPWYLYFPYEANFQLPAPVGHFPNWPAPQVPEAQPGTFVPPPPTLLPPSSPDRKSGPAAAPAANGNGPALPPQASFYRYQPPTGLRPVSYMSPAVPSYWYGR
jgi:hypothetical protein